ncbi:MAG: SIR2 family protein [Candidatus Thorarchaeota archaeon]
MHQDKGIVFFLGAGFSSELGMPATRELRRVYQRLLPPDLKEPLEPVEATMRKMYTEEEYDIEKIYTFINDLLAFGEDSVPMELFSNVEYMDVLGRLVKQNEPFRETLVKVKQFIMSLIEEEFWHRRMFQLDRVGEVFQNEIFEDLPPTHISILTTNYDMTIEEYFKKHRPEVKMERGISDGVYDPISLHNRGPESVTLTKLHGSIDLYETKQGKIIQHPGPKEEYKGDYEISGMHLTAPIENRKEYEKIDEQLKVKLDRDLRFASLIVVIGFSFRDPIIRDIFLRATMHKPRILVACGKGTERALSNSFFEERDSIQDPLDRFTIAPYRFPSPQLKESIRTNFSDIFGGKGQSD